MCDRTLGTWAPLVLAVALVALIVGAVVVLVPYWRPANLRNFAPHGAMAIVPASLTLLWVLTGWEASIKFVGLVRARTGDYPA